MEKVDFRTTSFTRIPNFIFSEVNTNINATDFMVYAYIASVVNNETKDCIVSTLKISDDLLLSRRTVSRSISNLSSLGLIDIEHRYRRDGGRTASKYTLLDYEV